MTVSEYPQIEMLSVLNLRPYPKNARQHSKKQIQQIARSIERFGFTNPVLISDDGEIIAGHGRVMAAKQLGLVEVPTVKLSHMSKDERRAYVLADNKLALNAGWDTEILALEFQALSELNFDLSFTGFSDAEIDFTILSAQEASQTATDILADEIPECSGRAVTRHGDMWVLGRHRILCGDSQNLENLSLLMNNEQAALLFTDPPYNVPIQGHVSGLGAISHREFAFASGEMSREEFTRFLKQTLGMLLLSARMVLLPLCAWIGATCRNCWKLENRSLQN